MPEYHWLEVSLIVDGELAEPVAEVLARFIPEGVVIESTAVTTEDGGLPGKTVGPLRVFRSPLPQCPVSVERAYARSGTSGECMNPGFAWSARVAAHRMFEVPEGEYGGMR